MKKITEIKQGVPYYYINLIDMKILTLYLESEHEGELFMDFKCGATIEVIGRYDLEYAMKNSFFSDSEKVINDSFILFAKDKILELNSDINYSNNKISLLRGKIEALTND